MSCFLNKFMEISSWNNFAGLAFLFQQYYFFSQLLISRTKTYLTSLENWEYTKLFDIGDLKTLDMA